jgi:hypothetical protein
MRNGAAPGGGLEEMVSAEMIGEKSSAVCISV